MMPHLAQLAELRQREAEAVERAAATLDQDEQEEHFAIAAKYVEEIKRIEQITRMVERNGPGICDPHPS